MKQRTIYYQDELNDEFAGVEINTRTIDKNYNYSHNFFQKILSVILYRFVSIPIAFIYLKLCYHHKIVNKKVLKKYKKENIYLFGNHTHNICDSLIPTFISHPKKAYVICHPDNVSMPYLGKITPYLGAIPLSSDISGSKNFNNHILKLSKQNKNIVIYPEAHIWPYYTKIRPFLSVSFKYPEKTNSVVFSFTNTYHKTKILKRKKIITYIDGPFFFDNNITKKERIEKMRNEVYEAMVNRSKLNEVEYIKYERKQND